MVLVVAALYSLARQYKTDSGETAADLLHRKLDSVVHSFSPPPTTASDQKHKPEQQQPEPSDIALVASPPPQQQQPPQNGEPSTERVPQWSSPMMTTRTKNNSPLSYPERTMTDVATTTTTPLQHNNPYNNNNNNHGSGRAYSAMTTTTTTTYTNHSGSGNVMEASPEVRNEWINAVFGKDFCCDDNDTTTTNHHHNNKNHHHNNKNHHHPPAEESILISSPTKNTTNNNAKVGLAGISEPYTSYTVRIPPPPPPTNNHNPKTRNDTGRSGGSGGGEEQKLGITVSKLALGLSVRKVQPQSEADTLGIEEGSVLISINHGMCLLAEPTKQALERMWQYQGFLENQHHSSSNSNYNSNNNNNNNDATAPFSPSLLVNAAAAAGSQSNHTPNNTAGEDACYRDAGGEAATAAAAAASLVVQRPPPMMRDPVALTLIKNGVVSTYLFLCPPPLWGIAWASCGNFPLVKRVYSYAAHAGVQRGSLVALAQDESFRHCDHLDVAHLLRTAFTNRDEIQVTLCSPPSATRSSHYKKLQQQEDVILTATTTTTTAAAAGTSSSGSSSNGGTAVPKKPVPRQIKRTDDGVEIRFHSLESSLGGLWPTSSAAQSPVLMMAAGAANTDQPYRCCKSLSQLAEEVAAGQVESPVHLRKAMATTNVDQNNNNSNNNNKAVIWTSHKVYCPCPKLSAEELLEAWDPLSTLLYCLQFYVCCCSSSGGNSTAEEATETDLAAVRKRTRGIPTICGFRELLLSGPGSSEAATSFLLQMMSVICTPSYYYYDTKNDSSSGNSRGEGRTDLEEKKEGTDATAMKRRTEPHYDETTQQQQQQRDAKELTLLLLQISNRDEGFCQRLYFLLRSYISSLETKRTAGGTSLWALLNCLELLRFAETQLAGQIREFHRPKGVVATGGSGGIPQQRQGRPQPPPHSAEEAERLFPSVSHAGTAHSASSVSVTTTTQKQQQREEAAPHHQSLYTTTSGSGSYSWNSSQSHNSHGHAQNKKKGIMGFLRKRPTPSGSRSGGASSSEEAEDHNYSVPSGELKSKASWKAGASKGLTRVGSAPIKNPRRNHPFTITRPQQQSTAPVVADDRVRVIATKDSPTSSAKEHHQQQQQRSPDSQTKVTQTPLTMYENMSDFLAQLDRICGTIERNLQKSFRQKVADWARQPWSATKDTAVANVTTAMRQSLEEEASTESGSRLLVNPVESSELLSSVDTNECYIIPSAHFPLLLTFNVSEKRSSDDPMGMQRIYRTTVELLTLRGNERLRSSANVVHAGVAGTVVASDNSLCINTSGSKQSWFSGQKLVFDTRSSWGAPQTLSLRLSSASDESNTTLSSSSSEPPRFGWVDLSELWAEHEDEFFNGDHNNRDVGVMTTSTKLVVLESPDHQFDDQGELPPVSDGSGSLDLELKVTTEFVEFDENAKGAFARKRMLLYKHDDDLRQEAFAVQFIRTCDRILKAAGLDMKLLTFQCTPVGPKRGFVEWVPGSVPLSEICQPFFDSILDNNSNSSSNNNNSDAAQTSPSMFAKAGLTKFESLTRTCGNGQGSFSRLTGASNGSGSAFCNPIQDYLRSVAYDADAPYLVRRSVMDTYIKSCAGYTVITYILGVGDRHLDNLLLHQSGNFFHCDFSFLLGRDPKAFQPVRVTEDMVQGMGGKESDNYAKFLSLASAAFLALRRPETVRVLLSLVRLMESSSLPDISENQSIDQAILGMRERLRLDLSEDQAVVFMEDLIERAVSSKMWLAVDAIHSLGKKF